MNQRRGKTPKHVRWDKKYLNYFPFKDQKLCRANAKNDKDKKLVIDVKFTGKKVKKCGLNKVDRKSCDKTRIKADDGGVALFIYVMYVFMYVIKEKYTYFPYSSSI